MIINVEDRSREEKKRKKKSTKLLSWSRCVGTVDGEGVTDSGTKAE